MAAPTRDVSFKTLDGVTLGGTLYPAGEKRPTIIMCPGLGGLRSQFLPDYAKKFQAAGYTTFIYDNRGLGDSEGQKGFTDPVYVVRDYMDAFIFVRNLPEVHPEKIVYWGVSFAGGAAIMAAVPNRAIAGIIAMVPFMSTERTTKTKMSDRTQDLLNDRANIIAGGTPAMLPMMPNSEEEKQALRNGTSQSFIADPAVVDFTEEVERRGWQWTPAAAAQGIAMVELHKPAAFIKGIAPTPFLMVVGEKDETTPTKVQLAAFEEAGEPKTLHVLKGMGHYDGYYGPGFEESAKVQLDWLEKLFA